jgi:lipoprotein-anchoring transpeptidase ErfK/SrfK
VRSGDGMRMTRVGMAGSAVAVLGVVGMTTGLGLGAGFDAPVAVPAPAAAVAAPAAPLVRPVTADVTTPPRTTTTKPAKPTARPAATRTRTAVTSRPSSGMPCAISGDGACVSLSAKRAWLVQDGQVVRSAPVTSGRPGERTPTGTFHVTWKDADHLSSEFDDAPMPWSVFFNGGIAFHTGSLSRQSAGCIHLSDAVARQFFRTLAVGDTVVVVR